MRKTEIPANQNTELIQTYYLGVSSSQGKKETFFSKKNIMLYAEIAGAFILIISIGIIWPHANIKNKNTEPAINKPFIASSQKEAADIIALVPPKISNSTAYYAYSEIKESNAPIIIGIKNSSAAIIFEKAKDLSKDSLYFSAMTGNNENNKIAVILKDSRNLSNANQEDIILTPALSKDEWQRFQIDLENASLPLDKSRVIEIRLDVSSKLTKNNLDTKIYIKNISLTDNK